MKNRTLLFLGWVIFLTISFSQLKAQSATATTSIFESILSNEPLNIHIKTDLKTLIKKKAKKEKHIAELTYKDATGKEHKWDIKIKARGNMRNKTCFLPPLKIDFNKGALKNAGLSEQFDDLKLVVHCKNASVYDEYVMKEYLAYKMYNQLTDISFSVQLVNLTLEDITGKQKNIETTAFIIENDEEMATRLGGRVIQSKYGNQNALHPEKFDLMCLFQYMIGNTDWFILNKHNVRIVTAEGVKHPIAVPYDFDFAGMVGTPYAVVNEQLPFEDVQQRYYLGMCRPKGSMEASFQLFKEKKAAILALCESELLSEKSRKNIKFYLQDFYEILESPKSCERHLVEHCDKFIKVN